MLAPFGAFISYVPLKSEVPYLDYVSLPEGAITYPIAPRAELDPNGEAHAACATVGDTPAAIFIPGREFDVSGTRHGRGGGWYDRFLVHIPRKWKRIGFCYQSQFSEKALVRESWDQPVDVVCVVKETGTLVCYEVE